MGNTFRVINYDGDIEISIYKKANAVFKTNEYNETEDVCIYKETINIFDLLKENRGLKKQLEELELQNFNLREDVMIKKISLPNKKIKDKTFFDLYDMPTYEELLVQQKEFIKWLEDKIKFSVKPTSRVLLKSILANYKEIIGDDK